MDMVDWFYPGSRASAELKYDAMVYGKLSSTVIAAENCRHGPAEEHAKEDIWPPVKLVFPLDHQPRVCKSCLQKYNVTCLCLEMTTEI